MESEVIKFNIFTNIKYNTFSIFTVQRDVYISNTTATNDVMIISENSSA